MTILQKQFIHKLASVHKIGEVTGQMWRLRNILDRNRYNLTVLTFPVDFVSKKIKRRTNKAVYNISMRGINIIHTFDSTILYARLNSHYSYWAYDEKNIYPIWYQSDTMLQLLPLMYRYINPQNYCSLTDLEVQMGNKLRDKFGIPENAQIVTFHIREPGYTSSKESYSFRNADIRNYIPAIHYLIEKGFYIVRLGDKRMKKLVNTPTQLIDAPFHPDYTDLVDPYFVYSSKFYFGSDSGPLGLAMMFGIPALRTDTPILALNDGPNENELIIFKKLFSRKLKRFLTYEEAILSPCSTFFHDKYYDKAEIDVIDNSPEEILMAVKEIDDRLDGNFPASEIEKINRRVRDIHEKGLYIHKIKRPKKEYLRKAAHFTYQPYYSWFLSKTQLSVEFTKLNPFFLGHEWSTLYNENLNEESS